MSLPDWCRPEQRAILFNEVAFYYCVTSCWVPWACHLRLFLWVNHSQTRKVISKMPRIRFSRAMG